jgi:hypothetical protein
VCVALHSLPLSTGCSVSSQNTRASRCTCLPSSKQKVVTKQYSTNYPYATPPLSSTKYVCPRTMVHVRSYVRACVRTYTCTYTCTHTWFMCALFQSESCDITWYCNTMVHVYHNGNTGTRVCRVSSQNTRGCRCTCVPFSNQKVVT